MLTAGALPGLGISSLSASDWDQIEAEAGGAQAEFWDAFFDSVDPSLPHVVLRDSAQPVPEHVDPDKLPRFFHYREDTGLRYAENIKDSELPNILGSALVSFSLAGYHPSAEDQKKIGEASLSQLQVHAMQTTPIAQYVAPLAWASLASVFYNKAAQLPTVEQLNFSSEESTSSTINHVLLPGAEGKLAVNVTLPPRNCLLHKLISAGLKAGAIAAPLLSLPAVSVPAIRAFTSFYNTLQVNHGFLINSPLKDAVASSSALNSPNMHADAIKLLNGQYVIVKTGSLGDFQSKMPSSKLVNGYLVPKDLGDTADAQAAAKDYLPTVTYAALKITVQEASNVATAETPKGTPAAVESTTPKKPSSSSSKK
jgi:hypothetical protein